MTINFNITPDWGYLTIMGLFLTAAIGYAFHDGGDPWTAAFFISVLILFGKAWAYLFHA